MYGKVIYVALVQKFFYIVTFPALAGSHISRDPNLFFGSSCADFKQLLCDVQIVANSQLPNSTTNTWRQTFPPQISGLSILFTVMEQDEYD